jgi:glycosyltransferase involved in cell wall biosynthesis
MLTNIVDKINSNSNVSETYVSSSESYTNATDTVIVIATYNRLQILRETMQSLEKSDLTNTLLIMVDDNSNTDTVEYLKSLKVNNTPTICVFKKENRNMFDSFKLAFDCCTSESNLKYYVIMDSDTIHKQDWLIKEKDLYNKLSNTEKCIITGFNTDAHPFNMVNDSYCKKKSIGGINILFDKDFYLNILRGTLYDFAWDWTMSDRCNSHNINMYCTTPSVIQHIGHLHTTMKGRTGVGVTAIDY